MITKPKFTIFWCNWRELGMKGLMEKSFFMPCFYADDYVIVKSEYTNHGLRLKIATMILQKWIYETK